MQPERSELQLTSAVHFSIADQDILEKAGEFAPTIANDPVDVPIARRWREDVEMEAAIDEKGRYGHHTKKADTLVELAMKMNIDPLVFLATVEKYNKEYEADKSRNTGKEQNAADGQQGGMSQGAARGMAALAGISPMPVVKGPFYAFFGQRFCQCTHGGMAINDNLEVFDVKGNIIPGLFAGGDCTTEYTVNKGGQGGGGGPGRSSAGLFGNYTGRGGGGLNGILKGYTAAINIAKYLGKA
jgi:hypothetical protein